jgi:hypothetical protein
VDEMEIFADFEGSSIKVPCVVEPGEWFYLKKSKHGNKDGAKQVDVVVVQEFEQGSTRQNPNTENWLKNPTKIVIKSARNELNKTRTFVYQNTDGDTNRSDLGLPEWKEVDNDDTYKERHQKSLDENTESFHFLYFGEP